MCLHATLSARAPAASKQALASQPPYTRWGPAACRYPFHVPAYYALILRSLTVLEGLALQADPRCGCLRRSTRQGREACVTRDVRQ